jgi:hypothetical protein
MQRVHLTGRCPLAACEDKRHGAAPLLQQVTKPCQPAGVGCHGTAQPTGTRPSPSPINGAVSSLSKGLASSSLTCVAYVPSANTAGRLLPTAAAAGADVSFVASVSASSSAAAAEAAVAMDVRRRGSDSSGTRSEMRVCADLSFVASVSASSSAAMTDAWWRRFQ